MADTENLCAHCNKGAKLICSGCQQVYYCNREHQKKHWKIHSKECQPCKVAVDARLGRHLIATRNIKVGEVVLHEKKPIVKGSISGKSMCLSCSDPLTKGKVKPCVKCGWPLCVNCKKHGPECEFTMKYRKAKVNITDFEEDQFIYKTIIIIRALSLRESNPQAYKQLLNLKDHLLEIMTYPNILDPPLKMASFVKDYYKYEEVGELEIAKVAAIIQINAYRTDKNDILFAGYGKLSYVEHNCRANCSQDFDGNDGIIHRAVVPISKGDHISISYVDPLWSTMRRRLFLARTKFFECTCERCKDPTEFGTMFSAFKCNENGCSGFLVPPTFLEPRRFPDFVCTECNLILPWGLVDETECKLDPYLPERVYTGPSLLQENGHYKLFKSNNRILHDKHFITVSTDLSRIGTINNSKAAIEGLGKSSDQLRDEIACCKKLIALLEILAPTHHTHRGTLITFLYYAIITLELKQPKMKQWKSSIAELKELKKKAHMLLCHDPKLPTKYIAEMEVAGRLHARALTTANSSFAV